METNINRSWSYAIVVKESDLNAVAQLLSAHYGQPKYTAKCVEGSNLVCESLQEVLGYENPTFRRIKSITIDFGDRWTVGGSLSLGSSLIFQACDISLKDTDDARALKVADEIEKRVNSCKAWYSIFTRLPLAGWLALLALSFASLVTWSRVLQTGQISGSNLSLVNVFFMTMPFLFIYLISLHYLDKGWNWLFPKVCFLIGRQTEEFEKQAKFRTWVLGGVFGTVCLGVVANLITIAITKF